MHVCIDTYLYRQIIYIFSLPLRSVRIASNMRPPQLQPFWLKHRGSLQKSNTYMTAFFSQLVRSGSVYSKSIRSGQSFVELTNSDRTLASRTWTT